MGRVTHKNLNGRQEWKRELACCAKKCRLYLGDKRVRFAFQKYHCSSIEEGGRGSQGRQGIDAGEEKAEMKVNRPAGCLFNSQDDHNTDLNKWDRLLKYIGRQNPQAFEIYWMLKVKKKEQVCEHW